MSDTSSEPPPSLFSLKLTRYYTCGEGDIEASWSYTVDPAGIDKMSWPDIIRRMRDHIASDVKDMPGGDLREMTADEVDAYKLEQREAGQ